MSDCLSMGYTGGIVVFPGLKVYNLPGYAEWLFKLTSAAAVAVF
jgi:hypothetical protein